MGGASSKLILPLVEHGRRVIVDGLGDVGWLGEVARAKVPPFVPLLPLRLIQSAPVASLSVILLPPILASKTDAADVHFGWTEPLPW